MIDAFVALERGAVGVETFRAEQGKVPLGWADLVPTLLDEIPRDPWARGNQSLRLTTPTWDTTSVVLYSVGPDAQDDGGKAFSIESGRGDLVYFVR